MTTSLRSQSIRIAQVYQSLKGTLVSNNELLDIYEGNLLQYILRDMTPQYSAKAYATASKRVPPINILKRVIDKLSTIYSTSPERVVGQEGKKEAVETDKENWENYLKWFDIDPNMQLLNEYFNLHKCGALEPFLDDETKPRLRPLPFDRFFVISDNVADPLKPTHFVKVMGVHPVPKTVSAGPGKKTDTVYENKVILFAYTDTEFLILDEDGEPRDEMMSRGEYDGKNEFGAIPFIYLNRSRTRINPSADTDLRQMTTLLPIMLTDMNYAIMFQSFSLIYTVDVESEKMELNPNVVLAFKSDKSSDKDPKIGTIKPELDINEAIQAVSDQLGLWLQSRGIRPGNTTQNGGAEQSASGISKMVDEMDTSSERRKTIPFFVCAEQDLFNLVTKKMHPIWIREKDFPIKTMFTKGVTYQVGFSEDVVQQSRGELLDENIKKVNNRFLSRESAIRELNPDWDDDQIAKELALIDDERTVEIEEEAAANAPAPSYAN